MFHSIRQLEEKNVANEIDKLLWSDLMDLVAFSNVKGEVALHRLSWTRAWSLGPPNENDIVKGLAWRPDGKVLAIGYSSGVVLSVNVENKATTNSLQINGNISCIHWAQEIVEMKDQNKNTSTVDETKDFKYFDSSLVYLSDFSNTNGSSKGDNTFNLSKNQKELNLLMIGTEEGFLYISIFGTFPCVCISINELINENCSLISISTSESLHVIFVTIKDTHGNLKIVSLNSSIFKAHKKEIFSVGIKYEYLNSLINHLSTGISNVKENWETILLEMDSKLDRFASKVTEGTLSTDFLDLLMFGISSEEMQEFLLHDLTKKGLEKFGQTIEMCYGNIQKLLLKNITKIGQSLAYHLTELRGMARLESRYSAIGLKETEIAAAIKKNGQFIIKTGEMQQVINMAMISYKAFFRWLYSAIMNLIGESVPTEIPKMTQQDVSCIAEFLLNFDQIYSKSNIFTESEDTSEKSYKNVFTMEKLGQYLNDAPLTVSLKTDNDWNKFLMQNNCINQHPSIIKLNQETSFIQEFNFLKASIDDIFSHPKEILTSQIKVMNYLNCMKTIENSSLSITCINLNNEKLCLAFLCEQSPASGICIIEYQFSNDVVSTRAGLLYFSANENEMEECHKIIDVKFYSTSIISILLKENTPNSGILFQFPLAFAIENLEPINTHEHLQNQTITRINGLLSENIVVKRIEGFAPCKLAVSGNRKVSIVLSDNKRKVRLYEMEVEEEDEEDNELTVSNIKDAETSL